MHALSKVTELPSAKIFPPQPAEAGGPALGARYTGNESSVLFAASRIDVSAYTMVIKSVGLPSKIPPGTFGFGVTAKGPC